MLDKTAYMMKEGSKSSQIAEIIREMLLRPERPSNVIMADEATRRLGFQVDRKTISRIRNQIGEGFYDILDREVINALETVIREMKSPNR